MQHKRKLPDCFGDSRAARALHVNRNNLASKSKIHSHVNDNKISSIQNRSTACSDIPPRTVVAGRTLIATGSRGPFPLLQLPAELLIIASGYLSISEMAGTLHVNAVLSEVMFIESNNTVNRSLSSMPSLRASTRVIPFGIARAPLGPHFLQKQ